MNKLFISLEKEQEAISKRLQTIDTKLANILDIKVDMTNSPYFEDAQSILKKYTIIMPYIKHFYVQTEKTTEMMESKKKNLQIDKESEERLLEITFNNIFETSYILSDRLDCLMEELDKIERKVHPSMW